MSDYDARSILIHVSAMLPRRVIDNEHGPYLTRYTLQDRPGDGHVYLHHFHRSDADRQLHNHPWAGRSLILAGGYVEERRSGDSVQAKLYRPGDVNHLTPNTFHRVDLVEPDCWTLFEVGERVQDWGFWDRDTGIFTEWRAFLRARGLLMGEA